MHAMCFRFRKKQLGQPETNRYALVWLRQQCTYGIVRAELERMGKALGALDMMIGAHALSLGAVLVTNDQAFRWIPDLELEDWMQN